MQLPLIEFFCIVVVAKAPLMRIPETLPDHMKEKLIKVNEIRETETYEAFFDHIHGQVTPYFRREMLTTKETADNMAEHLNNGGHGRVLEAKVVKIGAMEFAAPPIAEALALSARFNEENEKLAEMGFFDDEK